MQSYQEVYWGRNLPNNRSVSSCQVRNVVGSWDVSASHRRSSCFGCFSIKHSAVYTADMHQCECQTAGRDSVLQPDI